MAAGNSNCPTPIEPSPDAPADTEGRPAPYEQRKIERRRALRSGQRHQRNDPTWPTQRPEIVKRLQAEAEKARQELGDALTQRAAKKRAPARAAQDGIACAESIIVTQEFVKSPKQHDSHRDKATAPQSETRET